MYRFWTAIFLVSFVAAGISLRADEPLKDGRSPDGKFEVVATALNADQPCLKLRSILSSKVLATCEWGYGILSSVPDYAVISWSADSRFVAICTRTSKRTFDTTIFYLDGDHTREVKPNLDYFQNICGRMGTLGDNFRNSHISPEGWAPAKWEGSELTLKVKVPSLTEDRELAFAVAIDCYPPRSNYNSGDPEPYASVVKITGPASDASK